MPKHSQKLIDKAHDLADDDIRTGYHTNWDHAYECAWTIIEECNDG